MVITFSVITIATMLVIVLAASFGLARLPTGQMARYSHVLAGATIALTGGAIQFLGL